MYISTAGLGAAVVVPLWSRLTVLFLSRIRDWLAVFDSDGNFKIIANEKSL
jgi:hypothetical protein